MTELLNMCWQNFEKNLSDSLKEFRYEFTDVTLVCDDDQIEAHKIILSSSSLFFKRIFKRNKQTHPIVILEGLKTKMFKNILDYIYTGEATVETEDLESFLKCAGGLEIKQLYVPDPTGIVSSVLGSSSFGQQLSPESVEQSRASSVAGT